MTTVGEPPPRPGTALLAGWLLGGIAAGYAVAGIAAFFAIPELRWLEAGRAGEERAGAEAARGAVTFGIVSWLLAGTCLTLTAVNSRRERGVHGLTWIVGGVIVLAGALVLSGDAYHALPWYRRVLTTVAWATTALAASSVALLALPTLRRLSPPSPARLRRAARSAAGPLAAVAVLVAVLAAGMTLLSRARPAVDAHAVAPPAGGEFATASLGTLCDRIDTTPAGLIDVNAGPSGLFPWTLERGGGVAQSGDGLTQRTCVYRAESTAYNATLEVHAVIADTPDEVPVIFDALGGVSGGQPFQEPASRWDQALIDATRSGVGVDVSFAARDSTLVLRVRYAINGQASNEDRQRTAAVEIAADIRDLLRR